MVPKFLWTMQVFVHVSRNDVIAAGLPTGSVETNSGTVITTAKTPAEVNTDYFHLLVGICMESLCSSRATQPNSTVSACLNAFYSLLDSLWTRTLIGNEQVLSAVCLIISTSLSSFTW